MTFRKRVCSQRVNAAFDSGSSSFFFKMAERSDVCSSETLLAPFTRKKRPKRKMHKDYYWIGVQENIGIFSKS